MNRVEAVRERITYAFGHLVSAYDTRADSAASGELALDTLRDAGLTDDEIAVADLIAEYVHGNYSYTGEADDFARRVERGEV